MTTAKTAAPRTVGAAPFNHALKAFQLQSDRNLRLMSAALGATGAIARNPNPEAFDELWAIGEAARRRMGELQAGWAESWFDWVQYGRQVQGASTVSKLAERELNIVNQAVQLATEQSSSLMILMENLEVNLMRWMYDRGGEAG
jgi:hypothetical protein